MDEEDEHFLSEVRMDLMQKMKRASPKAMRPKTILSTNRKLLYNTSVSEQENISQAIRYFLPPLQF